jgi:hypothetical protein
VAVFYFAEGFFCCVSIARSDIVFNAANLTTIVAEINHAADEQTRGIQEVSCAGSSLEVEPAD